MIIDKFKYSWRHFVVHNQLLFSIIWRDILQTNAVFTFSALFIGIITVLQWLFNIEQLIYILFEQANFSLLDKLQFMLSGFAQIFLQWNNIVPISIILIALFQALTISLLIQDKVHLKHYTAKGLLVGLVGAGCVACGGSVLVPLVTFLVGAVSIVWLQTIGNILLVLAVVLSYQALSHVGVMYAKQNYK